MSSDCVTCARPGCGTVTKARLVRGVAFPRRHTWEGRGQDLGLPNNGWCDGHTIPGAPASNRGTAARSAGMVRITPGGKADVRRLRALLKEAAGYLSGDSRPTVEALNEIRVAAGMRPLLDLQLRIWMRQEAS